MFPNEEALGVLAVAVALRRVQRHDKQFIRSQYLIALGIYESVTLAS